MKCKKMTDGSKYYSCPKCKINSVLLKTEHENISKCSDCGKFFKCRNKPRDIRTANLILEEVNVDGL